MLIFQPTIPADPPNACIHQQNLALNLYQQNKRSFSETRELQSSVKKKKMKKSSADFFPVHVDTDMSSEEIGKKIFFFFFEIK